MLLRYYAWNKVYFGFLVNVFGQVIVDLCVFVVAIISILIIMKLILTRLLMARALLLELLHLYNGEHACMVLSNKDSEFHILGWLYL